MLCIASVVVSKQLIQMFNEELKIFLSIYVNFVTSLDPDLLQSAANINILTTDYVEASDISYLISHIYTLLGCAFNAKCPNESE